MLECLIKTVQPKQVIVSIAGLREGMVYDALPPELQARDALFDGCRDFAYGALQAEDFADPLWDFIMPVLRNLPPVFETELDNKRMIKAACLLAGLGKNLHPDYRPELVFADVLYMPVAGLTHNERAFLALILFRSYTHKRVVPNPHAVAELLTDAQQNVARIIGEVIRLSIIATGRSAELLSAFELNVHGQTLRLSVLASESALITDQVIFRLERLGGLMGYDVEVDTHKV
jgi:exopolyphosphatase/guanosine-5'-triphosphate,3'-diphosphate pyrophosphatase